MQKDTDTVRIKMIDGRLEVKDSLRDYILQGDTLEHWNYLDFLLGTYDGKKKDDTAAHGRPLNARVPYRDDDARGNRCRIVRSSGHETMPYVPGQWFPKRDETKVTQLYEATMLAFFKPWRTVKELKSELQSFEDAFDDFMSGTTEDDRFTMQNIAFYHECAKGAQENKDALESENFNPNIYPSDDNDNDIQNDETNNVCCESGAPVIDVSEDDIACAIENPFSQREQLYADVAIEIGFETGALQMQEYNVPNNRPAMPATSEQVAVFTQWNDALSTHAVVMTDPDHLLHDLAGAIQPATHFTGCYNGPLAQCEQPSVSTISLEQKQRETNIPNLNKRQRMAHDIVAQHLDQYLAGQNPSQRLVIVHGPGGTGKTALLNAITETFANKDASSLLARTATTGVAATIVGGSTLHTWAALPIQTPRSDKWITQPGKEVEKRRKTNLGRVLWLMIDEMSMLTTPLLAHLCQVMGVVRTGIASVDAGSPFGGVSILLSGDLHQFPPVASPKKELYCSLPPNNIALIGRNLYEQFNVVIRLEEQIRIHDAVWDGILHRARSGECTAEDISEIRKLVLTDPTCDVPDFLRTPWNGAILVTPRNSVRAAWNSFAVKQHCQRSGQTCYVVNADDTIDGHQLTRTQRLLVAHLKPERTNHLPHRVELAIGMKVMVVLNLATDADLANGSRGIITDLVLHPDEGQLQYDNLTVHLNHPPSVIFFKPYQQQAKPIPGLPQGVIPIFPTRKKFTITDGKRCTVSRLQFALTPAYAFTDFKSQGQTIEHVIVDLAKPPSGNLTTFNAYVALSRSRGRSTIRLLRPFDEKLFTIHPSEELRKEDQRLAVLEENTIVKYDAGEYTIAGTRCLQFLRDTVQSKQFFNHSSSLNTSNILPAHCPKWFFHR